MRLYIFPAFASNLRAILSKRPAKQLVSVCHVDMPHECCHVVVTKLQCWYGDGAHVRTCNTICCHTMFISASIVCKIAELLCILDKALWPSRLHACAQALVPWVTKVCTN